MSKTESPAENSPRPNELIEAAVVSDEITVRSTWKAIATGTIGEINYKPVEELLPGDWLLTIEDPILWDVSAGNGRNVQIDKGRPRAYHGDSWTGPGLSIAIGTNDNGFEFAGDVVLRQPEPVKDGHGVRFYTPLPAGKVEVVSTGQVVSPNLLLKGDERPPEGR